VGLDGRQFMPDARFGSISVLLAEAWRPFMSAMPPIATKAVRGSETSRRARSDRTRRTKEHHSKISSARPDSGSGMVMPSARAVFKLMNISTLAAWRARVRGAADRAELWIFV
jgi:hypothetical protein